MLTVSGLFDFQVGGCRGELGRRGCTGAIAPLRLTGLPRWGKPTLQDLAATRKNRADPPINDRQQPKLLPNRDCSPRPKLPADRSWLFLFRAFSLSSADPGISVEAHPIFFGSGTKGRKCAEPATEPPCRKGHRSWVSSHVSVAAPGPATTGSAIMSVACKRMLLAAVVLQGTAAGSLLSRRLIITRSNLSTQHTAESSRNPQQPRQLLSHAKWSFLRNRASYLSRVRPSLCRAVFDSIEMRGNRPNRAATCKFACGVAKLDIWLETTSQAQGPRPKALWLPDYPGGDPVEPVKPSTAQPLGA
jgi:hypothetical protein